MPTRLYGSLIQSLRGRPDIVVALIETTPVETLRARDNAVTGSCELGGTIPPELTAYCVLRVERNQSSVTVIVELQLARIHRGRSQPIQDLRLRILLRVQVL